MKNIMNNHTVLKQRHVKGKNRRVHIFKMKNNDTNSISYYMHTKRLINFHDRIISETKNVYSEDSLEMIMVAIHSILK